MSLLRKIVRGVASSALLLDVIAVAISRLRRW